MSAIATVMDMLRGQRWIREPPTPARCLTPPAEVDCAIAVPNHSSIGYSSEEGRRIDYTGHEGAVEDGARDFAVRLKGKGDAAEWHLLKRVHWLFQRVTKTLL